MSDLYSVLGVGKNASADEIKRAYRKEALAKHPDRGGAKEDFQAMQAAYDILSDPGKRAHYDATGEIPRGGESMGHGPPDLSAMFGSIFGGGGMPFFGHPFGPPQGHGEKAARGPNKLHEIGLGLSDYYKGKTFRLNMKREVLCGGCNGRGGSRMETCSACGGKGFRIHGQQMGPIMTMAHVPCEACGQAGTRVIEKCNTCDGRQVVDSASVLDVVIEPGMQDGDRMTFEGKCSESPLFAQPGDVVFVLRSTATDSDIWKRRGAELTLEVELSLAESLLGWGRQIEGHPSGRPLHIVWMNGVLREGEVLRIAGWGMPVRGGGLGDLRIVCRVKAQGTWSEEQLRALKSVWADWSAPVVTDDTVMPCADT